MKNDASRGRRAFTLIELMVVVSIIALLMAILLPALGKARATAQTTVCGTRLRAFGIAIYTYTGEFDGAFPINGLIMPKMNVPQMYSTNTLFKNAEVTNPQKWRLEFGALWRNMGGPEQDPNATLPLPASPINVQKSYLCPADDGVSSFARTYANTTLGNGPLALSFPPGGNPTVVVGPTNGDTKGYWSYSVNSALNSLGRFRDNFTNIPWVDPIKLVNIKRGSDFIMMIEEDNASLFNDEVFDAPAYNGGDAISNRHHGGGNVLHADGTVEWFNQVVFDQVPQATGGGMSSNQAAMLSPITQMFFPDGGVFAATETTP